MPAELSANLARFDGIRYGSKPKGQSKILLIIIMKPVMPVLAMKLKRRIMIGLYVLSAGYYDAYYLKAQKVHTHYS